MAIVIFTPGYIAQEVFCASKADPAVDCGSGTFFEDFARHAIWLPFIEVGTIAFEGDSFVFDGDCEGKFVQNTDGTAQLTGKIVNDVDPEKGFTIDIIFTGFTDTIPPDPPPNDNPKLECNPPQSFADWVYYTGYNGTLTGEGDSAGAELTIQRLGPALQVGDGASNKNLDFGVSGWFSWGVLSQPSDTNFILRNSEDIPQSLWETLGIDSLQRGDININLSTPCRVTGGAIGSFNGNRYHGSGQAGANTALQPQPKGEWTHHQQNGPDGRFIFHAGTASAPQGTEIDLIVCSDPGGCKPSGNPPSPAKQIDFQGIGTFKNINSASLANVIAKETYHWFEVHIEDLCEPGGPNKGAMGNCPDGGSGTDAFADHQFSSLRTASVPTFTGSSYTQV